ncbi:MAG: lipopolysaccharide biosynthesis protein [Tannerella sp.]|jgi:O-antigen/teichoic acid export membrane protein|nr:lipopolysaccharide biosynthesis protein [Tannerella sp.]
MVNGNEEESLKQKTAKGLFWGGFSNITQLLIGVGFSIFIARILNQKDYGFLGVLNVFIGIGSQLTISGFSNALINIKKITQKDYNAVFWFSSLMGIGLYILLYFCAPLIAAFFKYQELVALSRVLFITIPLGGISVVSSTILIKKVMVREMATIDITAQIISSIVGLTLALKGFEYWALAIQNILLLSLSFILRIFQAKWLPDFSFDFSPLKKMLPFSIKLLITGIFTTVNNNMMPVILGRYFNINDVGNYNQGYKWAWMGSSFMDGMLGYITQPVLVQVNEEKERMVAVFRKLIRFSAFLSIPLLWGLAFIGNEFILITIGEKWLPAVPFLQLFCIWGSVKFLWTLYTNLMYSHGKSNIYMYITIAIGVLQLFTILALYSFGIITMTAGYIIVYFGGLLVWQYFAQKLIGLTYKNVFRDIFPYFGVTLVCFSIAWLVTKNIENVYWSMSLKIIVSVILYISLLKILKSKIFEESVAFLKIKRQEINKK